MSISSKSNDVPREIPNTPDTETPSPVQDPIPGDKDNDPRQDPPLSPNEK